jgi:hypothetical protein
MMRTFIYSKWKASPPGSPVEFYSELDHRRFETRKVEIFRDGRYGYASHLKATADTRLGITAVPTLAEIRTQPEFEIREIDAQDFEAVWKLAAKT